MSTSDQQVRQQPAGQLLVKEKNDNQSDLEDLVGIDTPSKMLPGVEGQNAAPNGPINPVREMMNHRMELAKEIGILGPCSFEDCEEFADYRCQWKNKLLASGGCNELFCAMHGFAPEKDKEPACCQDCEKAFKNDKWRIKAVMGLVISIFVIAIVVVILLFTVILKDDSDGDEIIAPTNKREPIVIPTTTDIRVFSESLGFEMALDVNAQRQVEGKQELTWLDDWQNLAFRVAVDSSDDVDIQESSYLSEKHLEMDLYSDMLFDDQELKVVEVPQDTNAIVDALKVLDGGDNSAHTHIALAVYAKDDIMYFSQVLGSALNHSDGL